MNDAVHHLDATAEDAAHDALLTPDLARRELSVGVETGELRTRSGAAGRAVVGSAGTEHEVATVRVRIGARGEELDVVDLAPVVAAHARCGERLTDPPGEVGELVDVREGQLRAVIVDEEEPVAAPGHVSVHDPVSGNVEAHGPRDPATRNVAHLDLAVEMEGGGDRAGRSVEAVQTGPDPTEMGQRRDHSDRPMHAHPEGPDVVEEEEPGDGCGVVRREEERSDERIGTARLVHDGRAERVVVAQETETALRQRPGPEIGPARQHRAGRLSPGVRIDDLHPRLRHGEGAYSRRASRGPRKSAATPCPPRPRRDRQRNAIGRETTTSWDRSQGGFFAMLRHVHRVPGLVLLDHVFALPLSAPAPSGAVGSRAGSGSRTGGADVTGAPGPAPTKPDGSGVPTGTLPEGETIEVFAREVRSARDVSPDLGDAPRRGATDARDRPMLVFFQGGPGFPAPRPYDRSGWIGKALETHRVLLLDMRGMGRSTPVTHQSLARWGTPERMAAYLRHFRADAIVRDAEAIRKELLGTERWAALGQSYGGFCLTTYLSFAPEGLSAAYLTGGLPPLHADTDSIYRATYARVLDRNRRYFARYPGDAVLLERLCAHLRQEPVELPGGGVLSVRKLQSLGSRFGMSDGFEAIHYLLENAFVRGAAGEEIAFLFLREVENAIPFEMHPIYAILHEACYAQGPATRWSAERIRGEHPEFDPERAVPYFTGEMVYPWMFEELPRLRGMKEAAAILAHVDDWEPLYDPAVLARNEVPGAAVVYHDDMYVERVFSEEAGAAIRGMRLWVTNEYDHNGLRADGARILGRLMELAGGR